MDLRNVSTTATEMVCNGESQAFGYDTTVHILTLIRFAIPTIAAIAFMANVAFIFIVVWGIRHGRLPLKRYLMVINRSAADTITTVVALFYYALKHVYVCHNEHDCLPTANDAKGLALQAAFMLNYWVVALSYTGIALLTWYAVKSPLDYRARLTSRTVLRLIACSWLGMIALLLLYVFVWHQGVFNFSGNAVIHIFINTFFKGDHVSIWLVDMCSLIDEHPAYWTAIESMLPTTVFFIVSIASYLLVVKELVNRRGSSVYKRHRAAMWRLGSHLVIFLSTYLLMGAAYYGSWPMNAYCNQYKNAGSKACIRPVVTYTAFTAAAVLGWFLRMAIDAGIDTFVDGVLRRAIFGRTRTVASTATLTTLDYLRTLIRRLRAFVSLLFSAHLRRNTVQTTTAHKASMSSARHVSPSPEAIPLNPVGTFWPPTTSALHSSNHVTAQLVRVASAPSNGTARCL